MKLHHFLYVVPLVTLAACHGTPDSPERIVFQHDHIVNVRRSMSLCSGSMRSEAALERRFSKRDELVSNHLTQMGLGPVRESPPQELFAGLSSSGCVLTPEIEEGPFYVDGALIRKDIRDDEPGIPLLLDVQVTDARTCEPIADVMVDFWGCNSTGSYSGFEREGTGDLSFLRGLQKTDRNGIVQVIMVVPGWYPGRAQHIHVKAHTNYTINPNNTIAHGAVVHTGQIFFHQSTLSQINEVYPYTLDKHRFTANTEDHDIQQVLKMSEYNPFIDIKSIGHNITVGLSGFINMAIDPSVEPPVGRPPRGPGGPGGPKGPGRRPPRGGPPPGRLEIRIDEDKPQSERSSMDPEDESMLWDDIEWYEDEEEREAIDIDRVDNKGRKHHDRPHHRPSSPHHGPPPDHESPPYPPPDHPGGPRNESKPCPSGLPREPHAPGKHHGPPSPPHHGGPGSPPGGHDSLPPQSPPEQHQGPPHREHKSENENEIQAGLELQDDL